MKAARFYGKGDIRVEDVVEPAAPGPDQVLIEVEWCGICGSDLHEYRAGPIQVPRVPHPLTGGALPQILGHELAGRIAAVGRGTGLRVGELVAVMPLVTCGTCPTCVRGLAQLCPSRGAVGMSHPWGGFGRYALVNRANVVPLAPGMTSETGAVLEPAAVALHAVARGEVEPGTTAFVSGAGPIGALVVLAALAAGAGRVVVSEPSPGRAALASLLGTNVQVVDPTSSDLREGITGIAVGNEPAVAFECVGNSASLATCIRTVQPGGRVVLCGLHPRPPAVDISACVEKQLDLKGAYCYDTADWSDVVRAVYTGTLPARRVVTRRIELDDIVEDGFERLARPDTAEVKILVRIA